jgi:hypothetical protein
MTGRADRLTVVAFFPAAANDRVSDPTTIEPEQSVCPVVLDIVTAHRKATDGRDPVSVRVAAERPL